MKKHLLTGLIILLPIALTFVVIVFLFNLFTAPFVDLVKALVNTAAIPHDLVLFFSRVLALIFLCLFILILGTIGRWFLIKNCIALANTLLSKIPIVKSVYKISRDIISALFSMDGKKAFKGPVRVPFPAKPSYALGFQAGEVAEECQRHASTPLVTVFVPTAPHPISGFLFLMPKDDVHPVEMTNEEAIKFLVSCGMIHPEAPGATS